MLRLQTRHDEMPSPPSHQHLLAIPLSVAPPTGGDVGVANEGEEEGVTLCMTTFQEISYHMTCSVM